jgi:hypothetical protein
MKPQFKASYTGRVVGRLRRYPELTAIFYETRDKGGLRAKVFREITNGLEGDWDFWAEAPCPEYHFIGKRRS